MKIPNDIEYLFATDSAITGLLKVKWPTLFVPSTPLIFCDIDEKGFDEIVNRKRTGESFFWLLHELTHYEDIINLLPLQLRLWDSLFRLARFLYWVSKAKEAVDVLTLGNFVQNNRDEKIFPSKSSVVVTGGDIIPMEFGYDIVLEGLALTTHLLSDLFPMETRRGIIDTYFGRPEARKKNAIHACGLGLVLSLQNRLMERHGNLYSANYVVATCINSASTALEDELFPEQVSLVEMQGAVDEMCILSARRGLESFQTLCAENAMEAVGSVMERQEEVWEKLNFIVITLRQRMAGLVEKIRLDRSGTCLFISDLVVNAVESLGRLRSGNSSQEERVVSAPILLNDGGVGAIGGTPVYTELEGHKLPIQEVYCRAWISFLFQKRIERWASGKSPLSCPVYEWAYSLMKEKGDEIISEFLSRLCRKFILRGVSELRPSPSYCTHMEGKVHIEEIAKKKQCGFWDEVYTLFEGLEQVIASR
jgi:hypothetical protein